MEKPIKPKSEDKVVEKPVKAVEKPVEDKLLAELEKLAKSMKGSAKAYMDACISQYKKANNAR